MWKINEYHMQKKADVQCDAILMFHARGNLHDACTRIQHQTTGIGQLPSMHSKTCNWLGWGFTWNLIWPSNLRQYFSGAFALSELLTKLGSYSFPIWHPSRAVSESWPSLPLHHRGNPVPNLLSLDSQSAPCKRCNLVSSGTGILQYANRQKWELCQIICHTEWTGIRSAEWTYKGWKRRD